MQNYQSIPHGRVSDFGGAKVGLPENNESDIEISVNSFQELLCSFGSLNWSKKCYRNVAIISY